MPIRKFALHIVWLCGLLISTNVVAYEVDPSTFVKLPKHCQAKFVEMARLRKLEGMTLDHRRYDTSIEKVIGHPWGHMHHYCPGLVELIRLKDYKLAGLSKSQRAKKLEYVLGEFRYQLNKSQWSKRNRWFQAEVLKNMGHVYRLMNNNQRARTHYEDAINADPSYLPSYWELAQLYEGTGHPDLAMSILESGLKNTRKHSHIRMFKKRIEALKNANNDSGAVAESVVSEGASAKD